MKEAYSQILQVLNEFDFIMLNENDKFPSICSLSGDWNDLIQLILERKIFLTKIIEGKSTLLSAKLYFAFRSLPCNLLELRDNEKLVYDFIKTNGPVNLVALKTMLPIKKTEIEKAIQNLQNMLHITVIAEDRRLTSSWGTYVFGTADDWEEKYSEKEMQENPIEVITKVFKDVMSIDILERITRKRLRIID